jgi:hypothetical protein
MISLMVFLLIGADFPICTYESGMFCPSIYFTNNQYYVMWSDGRYDSLWSLYGTRVSKSGNVLDPGGKFFYKDSVVTPQIAYDGSNFLVVFREGC